MISRTLLRPIGPLVGASLLLLLLAAATASYVHRLQRDSADRLRNSIARVRAAAELESTVTAMSDRLRAFGDSTDLQGISRLQREAGRALAEADRSATAPHERELLAGARQGLIRVRRELAAVESGTGEDGADALRPMGRTLDEVVLPQVRDYRELTIDVMGDASRRNRAAVDRLSVGLLWLGGCGALAGILAGFAITRGIGRSLVELKVPIRDAAGKLNEVVGPVTVSSSSGLQDLKSSLREIADEVGVVVSRLQESQQAALRAEQCAAVGQLAAGLAHELRNPLTSMKILVQSAREEGERAALDAHDLTILEEEIARLDETVQTFVDYARPPKMEKRRLYLRDAIEQVVQMLSGRAERQGVSIRRRLPETPIAVEADKAQLQQVLHNLLNNACDAVPDGGTVSVEVREQGRAAHRRGDGSRGFHGEGQAEAAGRCAVVSVADTGNGLPADLGDRIFEPFVSTKESGAGLGLPICRRIVEQHGGRISAGDRSSEGAVVTVELPAVDNGEAVCESRWNERNEKSRATGGAEPC